MEAQQGAEINWCSEALGAPMYFHICGTARQISEKKHYHPNRRHQSVIDVTLRQDVASGLNAYCRLQSPKPRSMYAV